MSGRPQPGDPDFPYMLADTPEEFERARLAAWPAPSPAAAGLPLEDVERVARAIHDADDDAGICAHPWPCARAHRYRRLAVGALAEMRPTAAEVEARVQAAANQRAADAEAALRYLAGVVQTVGFPGYTVAAVIHEAYHASGRPQPTSAQEGS